MAKKKYLDGDGLSHLISVIRGLLGKKVDAEEDKGLSSNDFTDDDKGNLDDLLERVSDLESAGTFGASYDSETATLTFTNTAILAGLSYDAESGGLIIPLDEE